MKNLLILAFVSLAICANAQPQPIDVDDDKSPAFEWELKTRNFGEIPKGTPVTAVYEFTNTGKQPLIITEVKKTCGCTVPTWPREPIMPGAKAAIKATYNAANSGSFNKRITVVSNAKENYIYLSLKGTVIEDGVGEDNVGYEE